MMLVSTVSHGRISSNTHTTQDDSFALKAPRKVETLALALWKTIRATLATRFGVGVQSVGHVFPRDLAVLQFGRVSRSGGGDSMRGHDFVKLASDERDTSFIRVILLPLVLLPLFDRESLVLRLG